MDPFSILYLIIGIILGCFLTALIYRSKQKYLEDLAGARKSDQEEMEKAFKGLSSAVLRENSSEFMDQFLKLGKDALSTQDKERENKLEEKKKLIDQRLEQTGKTLDNLLKETAQLKTGLTSSKEETIKLRETTNDLRTVLSSSQSRGQWGEKMVEDILALIGLEKGINFHQQNQVESGERPDFTFLLPNEKKVNLDAKFPLAHYEKFVAADDEALQESEKKQFLDDVKGHIREVAKRDYINPNDNTVDYVIVFIPNESIYAFIHQSDSSILDFALEKKIILCSPITLYAVVSLIHQAVKNFSMEERAGEILKILEDFQKQWDLFVKGMDKMGDRINQAQDEYEKLSKTRTRQLEKPLGRIEEIRTRQGDKRELPSGDSSEV